MRSKKDQLTATNDEKNYIDNLPPDLWGKISTYLPVRNARDFLLFSSKNNFKTHNPSFDKRLVFIWVLEANINGLKILIKRNPEAFFYKMKQVRTLDGTIFYNISAYQLMKMLCHSKMREAAIPLIPEPLREKQKQQDAEMNTGGSDLVKIDFDPLTLSKNEFFRVRKLEEKWTIDFDRENRATITLLENPDGILCYQDFNQIVHFYYVDLQKETILKIEPKLMSTEEETAFDELKKSFEPGEKNSARRSTDKEHKLIETLFGYSLQRNGLCYKKNNEFYRDTFIQFPIIEALRKSIRLYLEATVNNQWDLVNHHWIEIVGKAQREVFWILNLLCPNNFEVSNLKKTSLFLNGKLHKGLGSRWALVKHHGSNTVNEWLSLHSKNPLGILTYDLSLICQHVNAAKKQIEIEPKPEKTKQNCSIQ
jgi:hypothetical protein